MAAPDEVAQIAVDLFRVAPFAIDLGALVEIDIGSVGIAEADILLGDVEETLLGAPAQAFGMHAHVIGDMGAFRGDYARHTRTSSS